MDVLLDINLQEMLGDLTVATFLMLLPASIVVVGLMVMLPLLDLAFEKKHPPRRHHDEVSSDDAAWRVGRPWLMLRSNILRQLAARHASLMSGMPPNVQHGHFSEPHCWTSLIKRTNTVPQKDRSFIVAAKEDIVPQQVHPTITNAAPEEANKAA